MNEELKIIIKAVTDSAKKAVKEVRSEIEGLGTSAKSSSGKVGVAMKGIAKGAAIAIAAIVAVTAAIVALGKKSLETAKQHAKLVAAFQAVGASAKNAEQTYNGLYRFLGDKDKATEAASHLALIARNQEQLAEWTKISQGIYARFGDSLPIEGLTEAANETLRVGKVTGTLADALNWAGVSEDEFNAKLATTTSYEEREALLRTTLNGLYSEAAEIYEKNNKALLEYNESQARSDAAMREAGSAVLPLLTALNNLGTAIFNVLKPALDAIIPPIATFVNWIAKAISSVASFFGLLTGQSSSITSTAKGLGSAASSAQNLGTGMGQAEEAAEGVAQAAEEAKRSTMGFDELNIVSSGQSGAGKGAGNNGSGASTPPYANNGGFESSVFDTQVQQMESGSGGFVAKIKEIFAEIATLFEPTVKAWTAGFETIKNAWNEAKPHFLNGFIEIQDAFVSLGTYLLGDFIPSIVNSFSTNLAPLITDVFGFILVEVSKTFEWLSGLINQITNDIVIPALETIKNIATGLFEAIGNAWAGFGQPFLDGVGALLDNLRGHVDNIYNEIILPIWNSTKEFVNDVWDNTLQPFVQKVIETVLEIGTELTILYNETLAPIIDWLISVAAPQIEHAFDAVVQILKTTIETVITVVSSVLDALTGLIKFIVGVFTGDWQKAWEGLKSFFKGIWESIVEIFKGAWQIIKDIFTPMVEWFQELWNKTKEVFSTVGSWFKEKFTAAWQSIKQVFSPMVNFFKEKWEGVKAVFAPVKEYLATKFSDAWAAIKQVFSPFASFFSGLWSTIKTTFSTLGTKIGTAIGDSVKAGINGIISAIERIINGGIDLINGAIDLINEIPGVSISHLSGLSLPRLAIGGIVTDDTLAHIGEGGYKEAVLPLDRNTEWMDRLADRIASRNNTPSRIVLQVDGKELGWATIGAINSITNQTGRVQLAI